VVAVKPQIMDDLLPAYRPPRVRPETLFLSIAAGKPLPDHPSFSVLPRCARDGQHPGGDRSGDHVACASPQSRRATALVRCAACRDRESTWVETSVDGRRDRVSGSGPAYVFLLIETLAASGEKPDYRRFALRLALDTVAVR